jgi:hypothetical protein
MIAFFFLAVWFLTCKGEFEADPLNLLSVSMSNKMAMSHYLKLLF